MPTYREYIYRICSDVDLSNKDDVISAMQKLANEAVRNNDVNEKFEDKLKELMTYKDFTAFSMAIAKDLFRQDVDAMEDGAFKTFVMDHFKDITGEELHKGSADAQEGDEDGHDDVRR